MTSDNSEAMRGLSDVQRKVKEVAGTVQNELGQKLASALSFAVVEEAIRRTGERFNELAKEAKALDMTAEQLQTLELAARRAGLATDKILAFYNKIDAAASNALNGNIKLARSFERLGIHLKDLKTGKTGDIMTTMFSNLGNPGAQQSLVDIFGARNLHQSMSLAKEFGGRNLAQYQAGHSSQIVSEQEVDSMASAWENIKEDFKAIGNKFAPVVKVVLSIIDGILKMVNGVLSYVTSLFKTVWYGLQAGINKAVKFITLGKVNVFKDAPKNLADTLAEYEKKGEALYEARPFGIGPKKGLLNWATGQNFNGASEEQIREAEGALEGVATLGTGGTAGVDEAIGAGAKGVSSTLETVGAKGLVERAANIRKTFFGRLNAMKTPNIIKEGLASYGKEGLLKIFKALSKDDVLQIFKRMQPLDYASISAEGMEDLRNVILAQLGPGARAVWRTANNMKRYGNLAELFGAGLSGASDVQLLSGENGSPLSRQPGLGALNGITSMFTGGSSQLSVGGVFGQDLQGKLIRLNETTNDLLQHIVDNTNIMAEAAEDMVGLSNMDTGTGS